MVKIMNLFRMKNLLKGLSLCFRCDQHLVGNVFGSHSDTEERAECSLAGSATVEAEDELIEVGLQML